MLVHANRLGRAAVAVLAAASGCTLGPASAVAAAPSPAWPDVRLAASATTTPTHPYSNPVWYPLATAAVMGCDNGNPGCTSPQIYHGYWAIDLISRNPNAPAATDPQEPVYAMGAGVVHIGATNQGCGTTSSRGNYLYIDHGNGLLSYYGHLGSIAVTSGAYVTARTRIGTIGNSGYLGCTSKPFYRYLFLAIKRTGTSGAYSEITHMYACLGGVERNWPSQLPATPFATWNAVPANTQLPAPDDRNCIGVPPPTPTPPTNVALLRSGSGRLRASWSSPAPSARSTATYVQFQEYHPTIHEWLDYQSRVLRAGLTATTYYSLADGRLFRVRISFANGAGWSAASVWREATATA